MKSTYTSNHIIAHYRKSFSEFPITGMNEASPCFNNVFYTSNECECYVDRSNNRIKAMPIIDQNSSKKSLVKNSFVFSNHTISTHLKNL